MIKFIIYKIMVQSIYINIIKVQVMKVKDKILKLREMGYSYRKIQDEIKCSKGTIETDFETFYYFDIDEEEGLTLYAESDYRNPQHQWSLDTKVKVYKTYLEIEGEKLMFLSTVYIDLIKD